MKSKRDAPTATSRTTAVCHKDKPTYFKLAGNVWAVNAAREPWQCRALPKYKQV